MEDVSTIPVKYVYVDVVGFTNRRSVEAQSEIVSKLNDFVKQSLVEHEIPAEKTILIPTGDGICISLLNVETPYDIHLQIALAIIKAVYDHSETIKDTMRKFQIRIGLNSNIDNIITDINERKNLAGAGINMASRIMDLADGNQILVSHAVYETLRYREKYMSTFKEYSTTVKHKTRLPVFQFQSSEFQGLNSDIPSAFKTEQKKATKLDKVVAYYLGHAIRLKDVFLSQKEKSFVDYGAVILLWFLALDSVKKSEATEFDKPTFLAYEAGKVSVEEQLQYYCSIYPHLISKVADLIYESHLSKFEDCFVDGYSKKHFVSSTGDKKLKNDWPSIWNEFQSK